MKLNINSIKSNDLKDSLKNALYTSFVNRDCLSKLLPENLNITADMLVTSLVSNLYAIFNFSYLKNKDQVSEVAKEFECILKELIDFKEYLLTLKEKEEHH